VKNKVLLISTIFLFSFMIGCQDKKAAAEFEAQKARNAMEEANKALALRYFHGVEKGDLEEARDIFSPDCVLHHTTGRDWTLEETIGNVKKQNEQTRIMLPDLAYSNEGILAEGDKAVLIFSFRGTHKADVEGIPATGNAIEGRSITVFRFNDGKIVEGWQESNVLRLYQQLGFEVKLKEAKK